MTKKKKKWSMYPKLHEDIASLLQEPHADYSTYKEENSEDGGANIEPDLKYSFNDQDEERCLKERDTHVMGRFFCYNTGCSNKTWFSKKVAITIRSHADEKYNARVYHQRCKNYWFLSRPFLDEKAYAERVVYWIKKWEGIKVDTPEHSVTKGLPHASALCEGCKAGHCSQGKMGQGPNRRHKNKSKKAMKAER